MRAFSNGTPCVSSRGNLSKKREICRGPAADALLYGEKPWLERSPDPHTQKLVDVVGQRSWVKHREYYLQKVRHWGDPCH